MTLLTDKNKFYGTTDATATAADIATGKTAYGATGFLTGVLPPVSLHTDVLVYWPAGSGVSGAFTPVATDMSLASGVTLDAVTGGDVFSRDGNGWCYSTDQAIVRWGLPAIPAGAYREYTWRLLTWAYPVQYASSLMKFNYQDTDNYWYVRLMAKGATSGWSAEMLSRVAATETSRGNDDFSATYFPNVGTLVQYTLIDRGDLISMAVIASDINNASSALYSDGSMVEHYTSSRPLSSQTGAEWSFHYGTNFQGLQDVTIRDIRDHV